MKLTLKSTQLLCAMSLILPFSVLAAHPMLTEDLDTQGTGKLQLDVNTEHGYQDGDGSQTHAFVTAATLYYGFRENADLMFTAQHSEKNVLTNGVLDTTGKGFNDVALDVKWRFYEKDGVIYGIKPGISFPTGDENKGLGTGKATYGAVLLSAIERGTWLYNWHVGYKHNRNVIDERKNLWHVSASASYSIRENLKLVADIGADTNRDKTSDDRPRYLVLGAIYSPNDDMDLDIGIRKEITGPAINYAVLAGLTVRW
jgi:hypothetical protein